MLENFGVVLSSVATVFIVFLGPRLLPVSRWTRQLAVDVAILGQLPEGAEKDQFAVHVRRQIARLSMYRAKMTGTNRGVTYATWSLIAVFTLLIAVISLISVAGGLNFWSAIAGTEGFIILGVTAALGYGVFQALGGMLVPSLEKIDTSGR
ncbi:hypothetical protein [Cryobacterium zongtaii]|uniref:hypothetical protein n=1 Tax=Cryobacterium zongtaii TaxID=1259217 RepID=UPI001056F2B5|nr:hypothetical protein [Cryobacterium zongtaii]